MAIGKTKDYNGNEFKRLLIDNGFEFERQNGDHYIYKRGNDMIVATKKPNKMMIRRMIKTYNLRFR
jgi:predicted RNA binding protein YcfA (HicA-like mRNA interferase family)